MKSLILHSLLALTSLAWSCCPLWDSCTGDGGLNIPVVAEATIDGVPWDGYHAGWVQEEGVPNVANQGDYIISLASPTADGVGINLVLRTEREPAAGRYEITNSTYDPTMVQDVHDLAEMLFSDEDVIRGYKTFTNYATNQVSSYLAVQGFLELDSVYLDPYGTELTVVDGDFEMNVVNAANEKICIEAGRLELFPLFHYD